MKVTKQLVQRFKELDTLVKSGSATPEQIAEAKKLAGIIKRGGVKGKGNASHMNKGDSKRAASNDISWYSKYPELLAATSNVIFNEIAGTHFNVKLDGSSRGSLLEWPGVGVSVFVCPTIGKSTNANDAFNYQMRDLWLKLHRAFRGIGTYEYADLGVVLFCIVQAFANLARAERIYGVFNRFSALNRSYPKALLNALLIDPTYADSLNAGTEIADFRYQLNRLIAKAKLLCLPKDFPVFQQFVTLFGNVFKDSENARAQWIVYDTPYVITYDPTFATGGSAKYTVRTTSPGNVGQTLGQVIDDLNRQFDALLTDTDVARMCSDILKAFGEESVQTLGMVPENFEVIPVRDETRLMQLHNSILVGTPCGGNWSSSIYTDLGTMTSSEETLRLYQEGGVVKHSLFVGGRTGVSAVNVGTTIAYATNSSYQGNYVPNIGLAQVDAIYSDPLLDTWKDSPSGEDIVEMTRQTVAFKWTASNVATYSTILEVDSFSTYVVMFINIYQASPTPYGYMIGSVPSNMLTYSNTSQAETAFALSTYMSQIDWHPYIVVLNRASGASSKGAILYDIDNYSIISKNALSRIHEACTMSLFKLDLAVKSSS